MTTCYLACGDVLPGGPTTSSDSSGEGLLRQGAGHTAEAHGIVEVTPVVAGTVSAHVRRVD